MKKILFIFLFIFISNQVHAQIYALFSDDGQRLISFFDSNKGITIPSSAIQVSDAMFKEERDNPGRYILQNGQLVLRPIYIPTANDILPRKIVQVKQETLRRIIILIPGADYSNYIIKETNLLSRVAELTRKEYKFTISPSELLELDWYDAIWQEIKAIRIASDSIETEINALTTYDDVNNYNIETNILWP